MPGQFSRAFSLVLLDSKRKRNFHPSNLGEIESEFLIPFTVSLSFARGSFVSTRDLSLAHDTFNLASPLFLTYADPFRELSPLILYL